MAVVKNGQWWYYDWKINGRPVRRSSGFRVGEVSRDWVRENHEEQAKARVMIELGLFPAPIQTVNGVAVMASVSPDVLLTPPKPRKVMTLRRAIDRFYRSRWSKQRDGE